MGAEPADRVLVLTRELDEVLRPKGIAMVVKARHLCMMTREEFLRLALRGER